MPEKWVDDIVHALRNLGGTAKYADLYSEIKEIRSADLPPTWQEVVRRTIQSHSSDSKAFIAHGGKRDIFFAVEGVGKGIWGLRAMAEDTLRSLEIPISADTTEIIEASDGSSAFEVTAIGQESPGRVRTVAYRILRDTQLARQVKLLHRGQCQVCGNTIKVDENRNYSEAHHIIPLGGTHKGADVMTNIVVLCPNHHAMMDMGLMKISVQNLRQVEGHAISPLSIDYHNEKLFQSDRTYDQGEL